MIGLSVPDHQSGARPHMGRTGADLLQCWFGKVGEQDRGVQDSMYHAPLGIRTVPLVDQVLGSFGTATECSLLLVVIDRRGALPHRACSWWRWYLSPRHAARTLARRSGAGAHSLHLLWPDVGQPRFLVSWATSWPGLLWASSVGVLGGGSHQARLGVARFGRAIRVGRSWLIGPLLVVLQFSPADDLVPVDSRPRRTAWLGLRRRPSVSGER
jgi:hypothetical protein